jgi:tetratricopeptide (TPR) repeat protein
MHNEAAVRLRLGQKEQAEQLLSDAIKLLDKSLGPTNPRRWIHVDTRAEIKILQRRFDAAEQELTALLAAIAQDGSSARQRLVSTRKLALAQRGQADFSAAIDTAERARVLAESSNLPREQAVAELLLALLRLDLDQPDVAAGHYARASALDPRCANEACALDQAHVQLTRGHYLARIGQLPEAIAALRIAIAHRDWSADVLNHDDLKALHREPAWRVLQQDVAKRLAAGEPPRGPVAPI